ncbi:unnamed protein product [Acanthoscelides obtectus]|uniref:Uncharacterized protein n=1 Tax=Acanthoscelides obtectus TaxID=200917 RepID=A0A9P0KCF5_ACAOB|nr:unnamed protein product [Acanthoscelides obtectus]CAK1662365.1 hypothetical protein AOBTE_LOCUS23105 [Acanthoscelides obtectus]
MEVFESPTVSKVGVGVRLRSLLGRYIKRRFHLVWTGYLAFLVFSRLSAFDEGRLVPRH